MNRQSTLTTKNNQLNGIKIKFAAFAKWKYNAQP